MLKKSLNLFYKDGIIYSFRKYSELFYTLHNYTNQRDGSFGLWIVSDALIQTKGTVLLVCGLVPMR